MAVQAVTPLSVGDQVFTYTWATMANGDTGAPAQITNLADKTLTVTGTFGTGGSVQFEGSNDGTNWFILKDPSSTTIIKTAAGISAVLEHPLQVRPHVTAGDGTTALVVILMARRGGR